MNDFERDGFERPPRLTLASKLGAVIAAKVSEVTKDLHLTDGQKEYIAGARWFDVKDHFNPPLCPLTLGEADSFRISFVSGHDSGREYDSIDEPADDSGNFAVSVHLQRDRSPFVYDEDLELDNPTDEYVVLVGPDMPPTMVYEGHLENASIAAGRVTEYTRGSWQDVAVVKQHIGPEFLHPLNDQDCENLLIAVAAAHVDAEVLVREMSSVTGFENL